MADDTLEDQLIWLLEQSRIYTTTRDTQRIKELALDALQVLAGAERVFFFDTDASGTRPMLHSAKSASGTVIAEHDSRVTTVVSQVLKDKRSIIATDSANSVNVPGPVSELRLKQLVCLPLLGDGEIFGALYADGKASQTRPVHSRAVEILGMLVATALDNSRMFERATNDLLTGLPNNSNFLFHLGKAMRAAEPDNCGGILLLDLDSFKRVNQAAGAEMGDRALIDMAHTLREVLRTDGMVARYGSDKFAILLAPDRHTPIRLRLRDVAERARAAIGTKSYHGVQLSACIGGVWFPTPGPQTAPDLVAVADNVLARARARGQGEVEIADQPEKAR